MMDHMHDIINNLKKHCLIYWLKPRFENPKSFFFNVEWVNSKPVRNPADQCIHMPASTQLSFKTCTWQLMEVAPPPEAATFGPLSTVLCSQINSCGKSGFFFGLAFLFLCQKNDPCVWNNWIWPSSCTRNKKKVEISKYLHLWISSNVPPAHMTWLSVTGNLALIAVPTSWEPDRIFRHKLNWNWSDGGSSWSGHGIKTVNQMLPQIVFSLIDFHPTFFFSIFHMYRITCTVNLP